MKATAFIATILGAMLLMTGVILAFLLGEHEEEPALAAVTTLTLSVVGLSMAGMLAGTVIVTSGRDPKRADGRRFFVRLALVGGLVVLLSVGALVVLAASGAISVGLAVSAIAAGVFYVAANVGVGEYLRRRDERMRPTSPAIPAADPDFSRRRVRILAWVFCGTLAVAVTVALILTAGDSGDQDPVSTLNALALALAIAAFAATGVCLAAVFASNARTRAVLGTDVSRSQRISRVVLRGKDEPLTDQERDLAARFAPLAATTVGWTLAEFVFLYLALVLQNAARVWSTDGVDGFALTIVILLIVASVLFFPAMVKQRRRALGFAAAHPVSSQPTGVQAEAETETPGRAALPGRDGQTAESDS